MASILSRPQCVNGRNASVLVSASTHSLAVLDSSLWKLPTKIVIAALSLRQPPSFWHPSTVHWNRNFIILITFLLTSFNCTLKQKFHYFDEISISACNLSWWQLPVQPVMIFTCLFQCRSNQQGKCTSSVFNEDSFATTNLQGLNHITKFHSTILHF